MVVGRPLKSKYKYLSEEYNRDKNLISKYGITLEQWNEKFKQQDSCCAICGTKDPRGKNWHTDHNHTTGKIRSILCGWCNTGLGKFQEDWRLLFIAGIYSLIWNYSCKEDLLKAIHNLEILIELEYGND
jgi:hypothetical protein